MTGGAGNDTYVIDNIADVVAELFGKGTDLIQSSVNYTLLANFENLLLTGSSALSGTGNSANNTLNGAAGADTYLFGRGYGQDTVQDNDATAGVTDQVQFAAGIAQGLVSAMASFSAPAAGQTTAPDVWRGTLPMNLAANALM